MAALKKAIECFWKDIEAFTLVDFVFDFALIDPRTNFCLCLVITGPVIGNQKPFDPRPWLMTLLPQLLPPHQALALSEPRTRLR